jgi:putative transposase
MGRRGYPAEFRRRVLDLVDAGRKVADVARDLGVSAQTIYTWRRQDRIDRGLEPGATSAERAELTTAKKTDPRARGGGGDPPAGDRGTQGARRPKRRYAAIELMAADDLPVQTACRVLSVSESGYYAWKDRPPSTRAIRHAWLTDEIGEIHTASRGTYGARRVHAELTLGRGIAVGHCKVELVMRQAGIAGLSGRPKWRRVPNLATTSDLVDRQFTRHERDRLWVTDITEHPTREEGVLRGRARHLLPAGRRLVDRQLGDGRAGHQRTGDGHRPTRTGRHRDP